MQNFIEKTCIMNIKKSTVDFLFINLYKILIYTSNLINLISNQLQKKSKDDEHYFIYICIICYITIIFYIIIQKLYNSYIIIIFGK